MDREQLDKLITLRETMIKEFNRCRDYKTNKNALMKETDHAYFVSEMIKKIDDLLKEHVNFS